MCDSPSDSAGGGGGSGASAHGAWYDSTMGGGAGNNRGGPNAYSSGSDNNYNNQTAQQSQAWGSGGPSGGGVGGAPQQPQQPANPYANETPEQRARRLEEERQQRIRDGKASIDEQFGRFDDSFFNQRGQAYMDYYTPQITDQYNDQLSQLIFALARAGTTNSSIAGDRMGDLARQRDLNIADVQAQRDNDESSLRNRVQNEKSSLTSQLNATGDAEAASTAATTRSTNLYDTTPNLISLGNVFDNFSSGVGNFMSGVNRGNEIRTFRNLTSSNPRRGSGATVG